LLLTKFFDAISKFVPGDPFMGGDPYEIAKLDPDKIYVENVRAAMRTSERQARLYCETAVRQGIFDRYVEAILPDDVVAVSAPTERELPLTVQRWVERDGKMEEETFETATLSRRAFYRLHR
jgi:hypothetical protein